DAALDALKACGGVPAVFFLHQSGGDGRHAREGGDALQERQQCVTHVTAIVDLGEQEIELMRNRLVHVFGNELERLAEGVPGFECSLDEVERVGHLLLELRESLAAVSEDLDVWEAKGTR